MEDLRPQVIEWAQGVLLSHHDDGLIIDTETTGLGPTDQIVQIGVIDLAGNVLLDALVKPTIPIPPAATAVHHIGAEVVAHAAHWTTVYAVVSQLLSGAYVVTYNADYDRRMIGQTCDAHGLPHIQAKWDCAMLAYARYWGDYNDYYGSYRWQKLTQACEQQGVPVVGAHGAVGDCQMTLALIRKLAEARVEVEADPSYADDNRGLWERDPDEGDR